MKRRSRIGSTIFTTYIASVKANNIQHNNRVSICVDDQTPPFSFVTILGTAKIYPYKQKEVSKWATKIAGRYMGQEKCYLLCARNFRFNFVR
jgi:general stress protein 26